MSEPKKCLTLGDLYELNDRIANARGRFSDMPVAQRLGASKLVDAWIDHLKPQVKAKRKRERQQKKTTRERAQKLAKKDVPLPYVKGSDTSKQAAEIARDTAPTWREKILAYLMRQPQGKTAADLERELDVHTNTLTPRLKELKDWGLVKATDATRPTGRGGQGHVLLAFNHFDDQRSLLEQGAA